MQICQNNNLNIQFSGATRTLKRQHFKTAAEIADVFAKHPNSDGIAGSLPYGWLKNILCFPKEKKDFIIKDLYKLFRETFQKAYPTYISKVQLEEMSQHFTNTLRKLEVIPEENQVIIKKRKLGGAIIRGAFVIQERGANKTLEPLFVKQFSNNYGRRSADKEGVYAELALGLHLNKITGSEHIIRPYFGDTRARYMVSKYETSPQNVKIPRALTLGELYTPGCLEQYFENLKAITKDQTDIEKLLAKKGFEHRDLHDQNIIITKNKKGNLIQKLIDLGKIVKING